MKKAVMNSGVMIKAGLNLQQQSIGLVFAQMGISKI